MQRNGQNPIKAIGNFDIKGHQLAEGGGSKSKLQGGANLCPSCKTEVPPKPGFRLSSIKCPKCGSSMGKK